MLWPTQVNLVTVSENIHHETCTLFYVPDLVSIMSPNLDIVMPLTRKSDDPSLAGVSERSFCTATLNSKF